MNGNEGAIVNITLKAADNLNGDYTFNISGGNYGIVGILNNVMYPEEVATTVHVNPAPYIGEMGYFSMPEIQAYPGETFVLPVSFTCENSLYSLAFAVSIPEGFEVLSVEKTDRVIGTFQYGNPEGVVNVAIYNMTGQSAMSGNDGTIVNITLKAADNLDGDYIFNISGGNYGIVGIYNNVMYPDEVSTTVHVTAPAQGDVNGDHEVNVTDVIYLITYLQNEDTSGTYYAPADVNNDNTVNISDVIDLINILVYHE